MKSLPLAIAEVILFEPKVFGDDRGFFFESFNQRQFEKAVGKQVSFVQDNHSHSTKNVLRGVERCIRWDGPEIGIIWPIDALPLVSERQNRHQHRQRGSV